MGSRTSPVTAELAAPLPLRTEPIRDGALTDPRSWRAEWKRGFTAMVPLWLGVVPFGITYGVLAQQAGFGAVESVLNSAFVFAGSAQMAMISLFDDQAAFTAIVLTAVVLNLRHILYGLSLARELGDRPVRPGRPVLAAVLTDESYGVFVAARRSGDPGMRPDAFLFGSSVSLYVVYVLATITGVSLGGILPDADRLGLGLIFPLSFTALLLPLIRTRRAVIVAAAAMVLVLFAGRVVDGGVAILIATIGGAALGATLDSRQPHP